MTSLYLHLGHSKTGSSYLQACLANSYQILLDHGIHYLMENNNGPDVNWKISSGNGHLLTTRPFEQLVPATDKVLFSSEILFFSLLHDRDCQIKLLQYCENWKIEAVQVLIFTRDPIGHAESGYQQTVKRGGSTQSVEAFYAGFDMPILVQRLLQLDIGLPDYSVRVANYDRHRDQLIDIVGDFVGLPPGTLSAPDVPPVNLSMTYAEIVLQKAVNAHMPIFAGFLSDALCERLPDVTPDRLFPSRAVQEAMIERLRPSIEAVNAEVAPEHRYKIDYREPFDPSEPLALSSAQLALIGSVLGGEIAGVQGRARFERAGRLCAEAAALNSAGRGGEAAPKIAEARQMLEHARQFGVDANALAGLGWRLDQLSATLARTPAPS